MVADNIKYAFTCIHLADAFGFVGHIRSVLIC